MSVGDSRPVLIGARNMTEPMITKKLCIIGDGNTGKTSVLFRFVNDTFHDAYDPTFFENEIMNCEYQGQSVGLR